MLLRKVMNLQPGTCVLLGVKGAPERYWHISQVTTVTLKDVTLVISNSDENTETVTLNADDLVEVLLT